MLPLIVLFALGAAAAIAAQRRAQASDASPQPSTPPAWRRAREAGGAARPSRPNTPPASSPALHPRTERPWCELRPQDLEPEDLADRAGLERWARCSTRTDEEIEIMAARFDRAFSDAATDGEALALAQTRDAMRRAFQAREMVTR